MTGGSEQGHVYEGGGWWPPGEGEGLEWRFERTPLHVIFDGDDFDISIPGDDGGQRIALVSVPLVALFEAMARERAS